MKDFISVLLLDNDTDFGKSVASIMKDDQAFLIEEIVKTGSKGLKKIVEIMPDIVVMDLILPELDGMGVLERVETLNLAKKPIFVVVAGFSDDILVRKVMQLGADYYFVKPVDANYICKRIKGIFQNANNEDIPRKEFSKTNLKQEYIKSDFEGSSSIRSLTSNEEIKKTNIEVEVVGLLYEMGVPPHMAGYRYLREAIILNAQNRVRDLFSVKRIYQDVAEHFSTTPQKVERCIRNSIEKAWLRNNHDVLDSLLGYNDTDISHKPSNAEFIATMTEKISTIVPL